MKFNIQKVYPDQYPELLKQIRPLPKSFDVAGSIPSDQNKFLCVIGSRKHSDYGKEACRKIILGLAGQPVVIVSGLAIGIDSIAHEAALDAELKTIAFPGSGLSSDVLYPASRRHLAQRIVDAGGALMSPFPFDQAGTNWTFPVRNRLMAGISHAVLIVEGCPGSGTLGTATYATELNRNVLIIPGSIFSELSYGPHLLMKEGATPVTNADEVMSELSFSEERLAKIARSPERLAATLKEMNKLETARMAEKSKANTPRVDVSQLVLSDEEKTVYEYLRVQSLTATDIVEKTSLPISVLNITISELEIKGLVKEMGGRYSLNW